MTDTVLSAGVIALPAEKFFWAVLDGDGLAGARKARTRQLGYLFEDALPIPIDEVQAAYIALEQGQRYLACGMNRTQLSDLLARQEAEPVALRPSDVPAAMQEMVTGDVPFERLNLLTGLFEPRRSRSLQAHFVTVLLLTLLGGALVASVGFERRTNALTARMNENHDARAELIRETLGIPADSEIPEGGGELRLVALLRQLERMHHDLPDELEPVDVSASLAHVLNAWPQALPIRTELLTITGNTITVRSRLSTSDDVQLLSSALEAAPGWSVNPPQLSATKDGVAASLTLTRSSREPPSASDSTGSAGL